MGHNAPHCPPWFLVVLQICLLPGYVQKSARWQDGVQTGGAALFVRQRTNESLEGDAGIEENGVPDSDTFLFSSESSC